MGLDANDEILKEYIDIISVKGNTDAFIAEVARARSAYESLAKAKVDIGLGKTVGDVSKANIQAEKEQQALIKSQIELEKLKKQQIQTENELLRQKKLQNAEAEKQLKIQQQVANQGRSPEFLIKTGGENDAENLKKTGAVVNDLNLKEAELTNTSFALGQAQQSVAKSTSLARKEDEALIKARLALKQANSQQNVDLQGLNVQKQIANKAAKEEAQLALGLLSPYQLLSKKYNEVSLNAKDLAVTYGVNSVQAKNAAKEAAVLNTQLQTIDKTVGQSQRNVGNYGSAFNKVFGAFRNIANILPGVGLSGLFLILFEVLSKVAGATSFVGERQQRLSEIYKEASTAAAGQVATLELLKTKLNDINTSQSDRAKYVKEYNKLADDGNKIDETQINNLDLINKKITEQIALIVKRAVAKAAEKKLEEQAAKVIDAQLELAPLERFKNARKLNAEELKAINKEDLKQQDEYALQNRKNNSDALALKSDLTAKVLVQNNNSLEGQKKYNKARLALDKEQAELDRIAAQLSPLITTDGITTKDAADKALQALREKLNTEFEIYKIHQQRKITVLDEDIKDDRTHYLDKIKLLGDFVKESQELIEKQEQNDIRVKRAEAAREIQRLNEQKASTKDPKEQARINENIKIVEKNLQQDILLIQATAADKSIELTSNALDRRQAIVDAHLKRESDLYEEYAKKEQDVYDATMDRFKAALKKREKEEEDAAKKRLEIEKELQDEKIKLAEKASDFVFTLLTASLDKQKNINNQQKDEIDKQKDAELAANDARVQSEQDKAANILIINSRAAQAKEKLDKQNAELEVRKAKFERAQQLFEIAIDTVKTLAKIKLQAATLASNPVTAGLATLALAQIPIVLLTSALSIASVLAKPIPRYFRGKAAGESVDGGLGMINDHPDGRTKEVLEHADGSFEFPEGRNIVRNIKNSTKIHPDRDAWLNAVLNAAHRDAQAMMIIAPKDPGPDTSQILSTHTKLLRQIANKRELSLGASSRGMEALWRHQANTVKYTNENTNWNE